VATVNQTDRARLIEMLGATFAGATARGSLVGVVLIRIESFDRVVSGFGHAAAEDMLFAIAERLRATVRPQDCVLRIGEAKFLVIVDPLRNHGVLVLAATKIEQALALPLQVAATDVSARARLGIASAPDVAETPEVLLQHAETALLTAAAEDVPYARYAPAQAAAAGDSLALELELETALKKSELEVFYQPKVAAADFRPCGAEALLRWKSPTRGFVSPEIFVPLADRTGRIEPLTAFVLNTALRHMSEWPRHFGPLAVAVNVTPRLIEETDLRGFVENAIGLWSVPAERLFIEVTEGALIQDAKSSFAVLSAIRELGVQISIDDFGTGYSSLAYFKDIPADELKIDKSFVLNMLEDRGNRQIVRSVIELAKSFGLKITAEGVENTATAQMLAELGCDRLQGYCYSRPLPQRQFIDWLRGYAPAATPPPPSGGRVAAAP
jgi:diguanylate cyclase (GGDEF)-like protein